MGLFNKLAQHKAWRNGVMHCTFNPDGPGVVRIHLIPPRFRLFGNPSYIVILNGYYLLPLGYSWAILLSRFIGEVSRFEGKPITEADEKTILDATLRQVGKSYPGIPRAELEEDLLQMLAILFEVARGGKPDLNIERLSIRSYAPHMSAPHRIDLMVSAMNDENGAWKCNQKCLFCYAAGQTLGKSHELSTEEWKQAIDKLRLAGVPMLTFTGGEPTLREDIDELIDYAKWFVTRLNTNGVRLSDELVARLKQASLDSLQVTLYSHDESIHNELVGATHFADTVAGIRRAVAAGLDVSVNTPLCTKNADYERTLSFIHSLGVRFVTVSGLICTGTAAKNHGAFDLTSDALYDIVRKAKAFCDENGMEMDFTSPGLIEKEKLEELSLNVPSCGAALSNMAIAPDGRVVPCQSWLSGDADLGNILTDRFDTIWNRPFCKKLRSMSDTEALSCPFRTSRKEG